MSSDFFALNHVGIIVEDLDVTQHFYEEKLGFKVLSRNEDVSLPYYGEIIGLAGARLKMLNMAGYGIVIEFIQYVYPEPEKIKIKQNMIGTAHFCLETDDVPALYEKFRKEGVELLAKKAVLVEEGEHKGNFAFYFKDPNGIVLEVLSQPYGNVRG